jgi:hypothetical protein
VVGLAAQRGRLSPPSACPDPVAGVWSAFQYFPTQGAWYRFTLIVHRDSPAELSGRVTAEYWQGSEQELQPRPCQDHALHGRVRMLALGTWDGRTLSFGGDLVEEDEPLCGEPLGYNLDHFSGTIDRARQEFQSVDNDGAAALDVPTVFRRVRCLDDVPLDP